MYTLHYDHSHKTAVPTELHRCEVCGRGFLTHFGRAKYCRDCAAKVHRKQKAESARKRRSGVDK